MKKILFLAYAFCLPFFAASQTAVNETITYVKPDGINATVYTNTRWNGGNLWMLLEKGETVEEDFMYHNPYDYTQRSYDEDYNKIAFGANNFALLKMDSLDVTVSEEEVYTFKSEWKDVADKPFFGFSFIPDGYKLFTYAWILPDNFEFVDYECNKDGTWKLRQNTLVFYGDSLNNLIFTIRYQPVIKIPEEVRCQITALGD